MQVVGGPNSTGEGMNKNKYWREVERELCLAVLASPLIFNTLTSIISQLLRLNLCNPVPNL